MNYISGLSRALDSLAPDWQHTSQSTISGLDLALTAPFSAAQTSYVTTGAPCTISSVPVTKVPYEATVSEHPAAKCNRISTMPKPCSETARFSCNVTTPTPAVSAIVPFVPNNLKRKAAGKAVIDEHGVARDMLRSLQSDTSAWRLQPSSWTNITTLCDQVASYNAMGGAPSTARNDALHWEQYWKPFCDKYSTPVWRNDEDVLHSTAARNREAFTMTLFLMFVWGNIKPKSRAAAQKSISAKPQSALNVLYAIRRVHKHRGYKHLLVDLSLVSSLLNGMKREFITKYGAEALAPQRKEFMPWSLFRALFAVVTLPQFATDTRHWEYVLLGIALCGCTGYRKDELAPARGETFGLNHLSRAHVSWIVNGIELPMLPPEARQSLTPNVVCCIHGVPSKADQFGEKYSNFHSYVRWRNDPSNFAYRMANIEFDDPVALDARASTPLLCCPRRDAAHTAFTHPQLDSALKRILAAVSAQFPALLPSHHLSRYSWHTFRITLATGLAAAGVNGALICRICRWATEESLKVYCRPTVEQYSELVERAQATSSLAACQASSRRQITASQYADLVHAAQQISQPALVSAAPSTPLIDDDATMETGGALDSFLAQLPTSTQ